MRRLSLPPWQESCLTAFSLILSTGGTFGYYWPCRGCRGEGVKPLKIVQIVTRSDNIGGAQVHLRDLSLELLNRGHSVQVLVGGKGPFLLEMERCGIPVRSLKHLIRPVNPWRDVLAFLELRRLLRLLDPDLAATHTSKAGVIGRLAAWSLGIPAVYTAHGWSFIQEAGPIMKRVYALAEKFAGLLSAGVITVSEYDRSFCLKHRILPPEKVATVHNGIPDVPYIPSEQDTEIPWLIMVARLERPKNHIALLKALALLQHLEWEMNLWETVLSAVTLNRLFPGWG